MALGNYNNNQKKYYEPILYSLYGTSNTEGVDPSALSYQFYNNLLKISISPMKIGAKPDDKQIWDHENGISVWLTHVKAKILHDEILYVMDHLDEVNNSGVLTGNEGLISFSSGKELGVTSPCLIIRKIDSTGKVTSVYAYQFKADHHIAIRNFDPKNPDSYESISHPNLEIENLITILKQYYESSCGAYAYATMSAMKYDTNRNNTKMQLIMDKLGIEAPAEYSRNNNRSGGSSFFAANKGVTESIPQGNAMRSATMDELGGEDID